jgi:uncharacterized membrane protein YfcA
MKVIKVPDWWDSIRSITTFQIVTTYCLIMLATTIASLMLCTNKETAMVTIGKELLFFIVGSFTGTAVGAIIAYHFKKEETQNGGGQK